MQIRWKIVLISAAALSLLGLVYWPGLAGDFFFDDGPSILLAPGVRLELFSLDSLLQAWHSGGAGPSGRPLAQLTFALNYYFSGFNPFAFKATNLAIHFACGLVILGFVQTLLTSTYSFIPRARALYISGVVAACWLLHPIQVLPILHSVQRMTSLAAIFLVAALWLHIVGRLRGGRLGAMQLILAWLVIWPLSCLSKETGLLFPGFVLAWELILHPKPSGRLDIFARVLTVCFAAGVVSICVYLLSDAANWLWSGYDSRSFSMAERLLTEARVMWFYLMLICLPRLSSYGLYHDDIDISTDWVTPWTTLPAAVGLFALVLIACYLRKRAPLISFGIIWFFIGHAMESTVLPLEIAHEHRNYIPLLGVLLAGVGVVLRCSRPYQLLSTGAKRGLSVAGYLMLATVTAITALRAYQFGDEIRRTQIAVHDHPESALAQYEAGATLAALPESITTGTPSYDTAQSHLRRASALNPTFKLGFLGLFYLNCKSGQPPAPSDLDELVHRLRSTPFAPADRNVLYRLKEMAIAGTICLSRTDVYRLFTAALDNSSVVPSVQAILYSWYADYLWLREHDMAAARLALEQSLTLNPSNPSNRLKWAQLLFIAGEQDNVAKLLRELTHESLGADERKTLDELMAAIGMTSE